MGPHFRLCLRLLRLWGFCFSWGLVSVSSSAINDVANSITDFISSNLSLSTFSSPPFHDLIIARSGVEVNSFLGNFLFFFKFFYEMVNVVYKKG